MKIRIGTRGSKLATWQANWVASELGKLGVETEIIFLKTLGDVKSGPIGNVGSQGVFTKEIQNALLDNQVDLAVHSLKDLPTDETDGLALACVPPREACGDALIAGAEVNSIDDLPQGAVIATGSTRRQAQLRAYRPDFEVRELRGNVDTRLQKLQDDDDLHAIILAEAGLRRLGLSQHISQVLPKSVMLPAVGQGALGLETREDDVASRDALAPMNDDATLQSVLAERALLRTLRGGCLAPIGAWARHENQTLILDAVVLSPDGATKVTASSTAAPESCEELGIRTANELLAKGADGILNQARD